MKKFLLLELLAIILISGFTIFSIVQPIQRYQEEELAKTTSQDDVKFLDVKWGRDLIEDGSSKSMLISLDVRYKVYIKIIVDENDLCYQKHNPQIYEEGGWGCNEECDIGECKEYELFMKDESITYFFTNRDRIVKVCWLRTSNLDIGINYSQYQKCETKVLNKAI